MLEQLQSVSGDSGDLAKLITRRGNRGSFEFLVLKPLENSAEVRRGETVDDRIENSAVKEKCEMLNVWCFCVDEQVLFFSFSRHFCF